ncbi:DUF1573 domain-containing protein [Sphingobacterium sp. NGMCC 1.201703]|uniref:DUF1573 domain-containing protein n=1 Tax=Sphingobacterium sp. NGMCC 1.201703 TaxID=3388657 RepID=UPI0039FBB0CA
MKKYNILFLCITLIIFSKSCIFSNAAPVLVIDKKVETQTKDSLIYFGFEIQNNRSKLLEILSLASSCDCTELEIDSKKIAQNGKARVKGVINTNYFEIKDTGSSTIMFRNNSDKTLVAKEFHFFMKQDSTYDLIEKLSI